MLSAECTLYAIVILITPAGIHWKFLSSIYEQLWVVQYREIGCSIHPSFWLILSPTHLLPSLSTVLHVYIYMCLVID